MKTYITKSAIYHKVKQANLTNAQLSALVNKVKRLTIQKIANDILSRTGPVVTPNQFGTVPARPFVNRTDFSHVPTNFGWGPDQMRAHAGRLARSGMSAQQAVQHTNEVIPGHTTMYWAEQDRLNARNDALAAKMQQLQQMRQSRDAYLNENAHMRPIYSQFMKQQLAQNNNDPYKAFAAWEQQRPQLEAQHSTTTAQPAAAPAAAPKPQPFKATGATAQPAAAPAAAPKPQPFKATGATAQPGNEWLGREFQAFMQRAKSTGMTPADARAHWNNIAGRRQKENTQYQQMQSEMDPATASQFRSFMQDRANAAKAQYSNMPVTKYMEYLQQARRDALNEWQSIQKGLATDYSRLKQFAGAGNEINSTWEKYKPRRLEQHRSYRAMQENMDDATRNRFNQFMQTRARQARAGATQGDPSAYMAGMQRARARAMRDWRRGNLTQQSPAAGIAGLPAGNPFAN